MIWATTSLSGCYRIFGLFTSKKTYALPVRRDKVVETGEAFGSLPLLKSEGIQAKRAEGFCARPDEVERLLVGLVDGDKDGELGFGVSVEDVGEGGALCVWPLWHRITWRWRPNSLSEARPGVGGGHWLHRRRDF